MINCMYACKRMSLFRFAQLCETLPRSTTALNRACVCLVVACSRDKHNTAGSVFRLTVSARAPDQCRAARTMHHAPYTMLSGNLVVPVEPVQLRTGRVRGMGDVEVCVRALQVPWLHGYFGGEENTPSLVGYRGLVSVPLPDPQMTATSRQDFTRSS